MAFMDIVYRFLLNLIIALLFVPLNFSITFFAMHALEKWKLVQVQKETYKYPLAIAIVMSFALFVLSFIPYFTYFSVPFLAVGFYFLIRYYYDATRRDAIIVSFGWLIQYIIIILGITAGTYLMQT